MWLMIIELLGMMVRCVIVLVPVSSHEVVGIVCEVGRDVKTFKPGDRIGVGCIVNSCGQCDHCKRHLEQYCERKFVWTYNDKDIYVDGNITYGGYSTLMVVPER